MQIVVNATFLINIMRADPGMLERLESLGLTTIESVLIEVERELGALPGKRVAIVKTEAAKPNISESRRKLLSSVDINLINLCFKRRGASILVTDDRQIRAAAKENKIACYTTPQFLALMVKSRRLEKEACLKFLAALKRVYLRKKDVERIANMVERR